MARINRTLRERILANIMPVTESGCWIWMGPITDTGYGRIGGRNGVVAATHRASYEVFVGEIPDGLDLDHLCRVRCCVNPAHLEPVTRRENLRRGKNHNREVTACPAGHPYDVANTCVRPNGTRVCLACARIQQRKKSRILGRAIRGHYKSDL